MPTYVWKAKDRFGTPIVREIQSDTVEQSKAALQSDGCTELALMTDDIMAAASSGMVKKVTFLGEEIKVSEAEKLKYRNQRPPSFFSALWEGMGRGKRFVLVIFGAAALAGYQRSWVGLALSLVALLAWVAFVVGVRLPSIYYARLHKAADWYRWDEVLAIVSKLKTIGKLHFIKVPASELARYRARALAAKGQLTEALAEYSQYENQPGCPSWLYKAFVAGIYDSAKQYDKAIEWTLKSIEEKPNPVMYLDLANRYARRKGDVIKAREALEEAEKGTLPEITKSGRLRYGGIVAYLEGNYAEARRELEASLALLAKTPHQPYRDGHVSIGRAYLCCVLARQGDVEGARKNLEAARDYLVATEEDGLFKECTRILGA